MRVLKIAFLPAVLILLSCSKKGNAPVSVVPVTATDTSGYPPYQWKEHWFSHDQLLTRVFFDSGLAVYFDKDMYNFIEWPSTYLDSVWKYTKKVYGKFGTDERLFAVFHAGKNDYSGGHPFTFFDESHDFRNGIDVGSALPDGWVSGAGNDIDISTHEVGHIVEGASKGVHNSPAFGLWGDSKWMEIFQYDVYLGLGRKEDAARWYKMMVDPNHSDDFPSANAHWFRDWWYPMYTQFGGARLLNAYFTLLSENFPTRTYMGDYREYTRDLNWGEFIHFWSGAAGTSLRDLTTKAFGWTPEWEAQFQQAKIDFPNIGYTGK